MSFAVKGFQIPKVFFERDTLTDTYGKLIAEPLERGFGITLGNALRRVLLSSIDGAAITHVRIPGVYHELSTIEGVKEDMVELILNLKQIRFRIEGDANRVARIDVKGPKDIKAGDLNCEANLTVLTPDVHIATIDKGAEFKAELFVQKGRGYVPAESHRDEEMPVDVIPIDALYSPIKRVNFQIENTRVGEITNYDRLILEIWTDGSITPEEAVTKASSILIEYFDFFIFHEKEVEHGGEATAEVIGEKEIDEQIMEYLKKPIEELEFSVRAYNCLKNAGISTIGELVQKTENDLMRTKNFGRKSLHEIKQILGRMGLKLGMRIDTESLLEKGGVESAS